MTISKKQLEAACHAEYWRGHNIGFDAGVKAEGTRLATEFNAAKLAQMNAASKLLEEAGRIMSRAGYMVGKINGDNSR